jgi:hypothetical protein
MKVRRNRNERETCLMEGLGANARFTAPPPQGTEDDSTVMLFGYFLGLVTLPNLEQMGVFGKARASCWRWRY